MAIQLKQVFHMKEGTDETSYAKASYVQKQLLLLTKPIKEKAIRELYCEELAQATTICMADLGCSSAELNNNSSVILHFIEAIDEVHRDHGHFSPKEYQIYLNDLPSNDFNTVFKTLPSFQDNLKHIIGDSFGHCFVNGVPGSFYDRLFPTKSLHFVHSSSSLHWLSQVPEGIEETKGNIYNMATSPLNVSVAYYEQFQHNFLTFLHCRSIELVAGGKMVLTLMVRQDNDPYALLATVLNDMVSQGYIKEEKLHTFNLPIYAPSPEELELLVKKDGSFDLNHVHFSEIDWTPNNDSSQYDFANCIRSVAEPLLATHFGEEIIEEVFHRYKKFVNVQIAKNKKNVILNVTLSLTRKYYS